MFVQQEKTNQKVINSVNDLNNLNNILTEIGSIRHEVTLYKTSKIAEPLICESPLVGPYDVPGPLKQCTQGVIQTLSSFNDAFNIPSVDNQNVPSYI